MRFPRLCPTWLLISLAAFTGAAVAQSRVPARDLDASASGAVMSAVPSDASFRRYAGQPYVIEQYTTKIRFAADGSQERRVFARVRIQSALAAQKFSFLSFDYNSTEQIFQFRSVQVIKPEGTRTAISTDAVKDGPAPVIRDAPAYDSYREKVIDIPDLHPGDTLEYETASRSMHAALNGQFWMEHRFLTDAIVLTEILEIEVPKSRRVTLKSAPPYSTDTTSSVSFTNYRWKRSNLNLPSEGNPAKTSSERTQKPADVELTTFASWGDVARWYNEVSRTEATLSPQVRDRAAEVTRSSTTAPEKIRAIYDFVSTNISYVDLPFAVGATESHSAEQILSQRYATASDKNILLSAMLKAAGVVPEIALLADSRPFDASFPSPGQFDRVLTVIHEDGHTIWLDPSSGVAPFQFLPASLRRKAALLISREGTVKMETTPADPPFRSMQQVEIQGQISELGKLTARIRYDLRGDNEYVLRLAFHRTPEAQWKQLGQTILAFDGIHGEIGTVTPSDPTRTEMPFVLQIEYAQPNFLDWASAQQKIAVPLSTIGMPDPPKEDLGAIIHLGTPLGITARLSLALPENFSARPPTGVGVSREYAEFHSSYHFADHTLNAERSLDFKVRDLPSSSARDYLAFSHAVTADQSQPLVIENSKSGTGAIPEFASESELLEAGAEALASGNTRSSIPLLERAVALALDDQQARSKLGLSYLRARQFGAASAVFQKQIELNPADPQAHNYLGLALEQQNKSDEAVEAFRGQLALDPLDKVAREALGAIYLFRHEYEQAIPELEKAAVLSPEKAELQLDVGEAYANLAQNDLAVAAFEKAAALSGAPAISNAVARRLADHKLALAKAQKYAESAVSSGAEKIQGIDPAHVSAEQFGAEAKLAAYWDTLGWVYCQEGDLDLAQRYIRAAWLLNQRGEIASHLARVYEKRGQRDQAIRTYALALAAPAPDPEAKAPLTLLLAGNSQISGLADQARETMASLLSFKVGRPTDGPAKSDFFVILSPVPGNRGSSRAAAARFISGSEKLRPFANRLLALDFGPLFPDALVKKIVRRGTLLCSDANVECTFTLLPLISKDTTNQ